MGTDNMQITCGRGRAENGVTPRVMRGEGRDEEEKEVERDERWAGARQGREGELELDRPRHAQ